MLVLHHRLGGDLRESSESRRVAVIHTRSTSHPEVEWVTTNPLRSTGLLTAVRCAVYADAELHRTRWCLVMTRTWLVSARSSNFSSTANMLAAQTRPRKRWP